MAKERVRIPAKTREQVLKEYCHLCAICGAVGPQLHHIDEDPSNNDPMNLIPLCANHHLTDQHNPTRKIETGILSLFRQYRDPAILSPQFHALYTRMKFLDLLGLHDYTWEPATPIVNGTLQLIGFVECLEMGAFYSKELALLMLGRKYRGWILDGNSAFSLRTDPNDFPDEVVNPEGLKKVRGDIESLLVELLRFQGWDTRL